jgi:ABC-type Mn2+/Zn2+ transport system permease subunit
MPYQIILTLISGIFISGIAGYLGTLMLSKKMSVVAGPLAHLAFPGVALALIFGFNISFGVFPFVILGAIFIWYFEKRTKLPMENLAAVIFAIGVGTALLFLPIGKAEEALVGSINKITFGETIVVVSLSTLIFFIVKNLYQKMMLVNIDEDLAKTEGINVPKYNLFYLLSIAIVIALSVYLVGGLITAALVAIPAAAAKNVSRDLKSYIRLATFFGIISAVTGIVIAQFIHLPIGPMVIVTNAILFLISVFLMKRIF